MAFSLILKFLLSECYSLIWPEKSPELVRTRNVIGSPFFFFLLAVVEGVIDLKSLSGWSHHWVSCLTWGQGAEHTHPLQYIKQLGLRAAILPIQGCLSRMNCKQSSSYLPELPVQNFKMRARRSEHLPLHKEQGSMYATLVPFSVLFYHANTEVHLNVTNKWSATIYFNTKGENQVNISLNSQQPLGIIGILCRYLSTHLAS